jgi:putative transposase
MPDHVDLLVEIPPAVARSEFMRVAKGRSSRLLRAELAALRRLPCLWSRSWLGSMVGGAPVEVVGRDVENQRTAA